MSADRDGPLFLIGQFDLGGVVGGVEFAADGKAGCRGVDDEVGGPPLAPQHSVLERRSGRFPRSPREPGPGSCHLHAERRPGSRRVSPGLIPKS